MSAYLGFNPSLREDSYFVSYNTEDQDKVRILVEELHNKGVPLWYDHGLKPGKEWEMQIESHIKTCRAVIMFITSKIFIKEFL